jgi:BirA family biotin operon repressor/biotin-[acetyl-CoA-carboxylase] ligase
LAAIEACEGVAGVRPSLTWPNDLYVENRKLGGILAEGARQGTEIIGVVVGMGMNVNWPEDVPAHLADRLVSLNRLAGHTVDVSGLDRLLESFAAALGRPDRRLPRNLATIGRRVDDGG